MQPCKPTITTLGTNKNEKVQTTVFLSITFIRVTCTKPKISGSTLGSTAELEVLPKHIQLLSGFFFLEMQRLGKVSEQSFPSWVGQMCQVERSSLGRLDDILGPLDFTQFFCGPIQYLGGF